MTDTTYEVSDRSSHYIYDVVISQDNSELSIYARNKDENVSYRRIFTADIIGIGLVKIQNRKCIRLVYLSRTDSRIFLYAGDEDIYRVLVSRINAYKRCIE
jgi:hypothetical protein